MFFCRYTPVHNFVFADTQDFGQKSVLQPGGGSRNMGFFKLENFSLALRAVEKHILTDYGFFRDVTFLGTSPFLGTSSILGTAPFLAPDAESKLGTLVMMIR